MTRSLIKEFDPLAYVSSPDAQEQTTSLYFQRQHSDYGKFHFLVSDSTLILGGDLFIIGRPTQSAKFVTLYTFNNMQNLDDDQIVHDIPLLHEMRILTLNVSFSAPFNIRTFVQE